MSKQLDQFQELVSKSIQLDQLVGGSTITVKTVGGWFYVDYATSAQTTIDHAYAVWQSMGDPEIISISS